MTTATVSSKSQITLPAAARREAGIKPHDRVLVEVREGAIVIRSAPDLMAFKGALGKALPRDVEVKRTVRAVADRLKRTS
jgi:AbrB family looped-hinge helix DNA binding protein